MKLNFFKYQGTGNDFILIDSRFENKEIEKKHFTLKKLCDRNFGVGADGIIFIKNDENNFSDFYMKYHNSDGKESTMCGNGGRCAVFFAYRKLKLGGERKKEEVHYRAIDGFHHGIINDDNLISISLIDIKKNEIEIHQKHVFLNTGSPHHILFVKNIKKIDVYQEGKKIRFQNSYLKNGGVNVNFVEIVENDTVFVRTYERGVENETLSCGTGAVASVIAGYETNRISSNKIMVNTMGGKLWVSLKETKNEYKNIYLTGPVQFIFEGYVKI
ncbi:diaminopimelate epimerase [Blattabacterium cuenoti]|uniref:diaminopimelate epimerase n=1 Tax=Blattabacterium cuenoti TaxID=1653831 RepID=UPI00163C019B|nr:diaminopimelate epimerase [Blattabacterium cuenoti]